MLSSEPYHPSADSSMANPPQVAQEQDEAGPVRVSPETLTVTQLQQQRQVLENEVSHLTDTVAKLKAAQQAYDMSSKVLADMTPDKEGREILVPLTNSVFIPGKVGDCKSVLLNIGTGYFIEKPVSGAKDHCESKSKMLSENITNFSKILNEKRNYLEICLYYLKQKIETQK